jgi:NodT family efflux transporter outer membrane factor (OMF) lipoprotein
VTARDVVRTGSRIAVTAVVAALVSCRAVGPTYERPDAPVPATWAVPEPWRPADPKDTVARGEWWKVYNDASLDELEKDVAIVNQSLEAASARYDQARALAAIAFAGRYPVVSWNRTIERQRLSGNRPGNPSPGTALTESDFELPFTASYEVDFFGKRHRSLEAAEASLQASAADLETSRLGLSAEMARNYFALTQTDAEIDVLDRAVQALERGLQLVQARRDGGLASGLDVAQEETLLNSTRTQATLVRRDRATLEHAIAQLAGQAAPDFHLPARPLVAEPPAMAVGLPSDVLERRPDVAFRERQMAAANARIGVAMSAYFPSITLFGSGGWQSTALGSVFNAASTLWSIGAAATQQIFNGGANKAGVQFATAAYNESVANYRESVLNAFREVEDAISGLGVLHDARTSQTAAVDAAQRALDIATSRYQGGLANYLDVVSAQENLFQAERLVVQIRGEELQTSVGLVTALGGGWDATSLAAVKAVQPKPAKSAGGSGGSRE